VEDLVPIIMTPDIMEIITVTIKSSIRVTPLFTLNLNTIELYDHQKTLL